MSARLPQRADDARVDESRPAEERAYIRSREAFDHPMHRLTPYEGRFEAEGEGGRKRRVRPVDDQDAHATTKSAEHAAFYALIAPMMMSDLTEAMILRLCHNLRSAAVSALLLGSL